MGTYPGSRLTLPQRTHSRSNAWECSHSPSLQTGPLVYTSHLQTHGGLVGSAVHLKPNLSASKAPCSRYSRLNLIERIKPDLRSHGSVLLIPPPWVASRTTSYSRVYGSHNA